MKSILYISTILFSFSTLALAVPVQVLVQSSNGPQFSWNYKVNDADSPEESFKFKSETSDLVVKVAHRSWPAGRSYPGRLDIYLETENGTKIGGGLFSINSKEALKNFGQLGFKINYQDTIYTVSLISSGAPRGALTLKEVAKEILLLDVVSGPLGSFQMVRPVSLHRNSAEMLTSKTYGLDGYPFTVEFRAVQLRNKRVIFSLDLYSTSDNKLLHSSFYESARLKDFLSAMFVGRYFHTGHDFKLIYYPANGQQHATM